MRILSLPLILLAGAASAQGPLTVAWSAETGSPEATIGDVAWMAGHWRGEALGGVVEEVWTPPLGGSMMGAFQLVADGRVAFYELETLTEAEGSLVLRLKHFDAKLRGWEEKDETVDFRLVRLEPDRAWFDGLTVERSGPDALTIHVRLEEDHVASFRYARVRD